MSDYSELKRLAEAATIGDKPASTPIKELIGAQDAFRSECRPEKVLALIAENESLRDVLGIDPRHHVGKATIEGLKDSRDQLKAEIAGLRTGYQAYERVNAELYADVGALRKELRLMDVLAEAMAEVKATSDGESAQPIADIVSGCLAEIAALGKGEQS